MSGRHTVSHLITMSFMLGLLVLMTRLLMIGSTGLY